MMNVNGKMIAVLGFVIILLTYLADSILPRLKTFSIMRRQSPSVEGENSCCEHMHLSKDMT